MSKFRKTQRPVAFVNFMYSMEMHVIGQTPLLGSS